MAKAKTGPVAKKTAKKVSKKVTPGVTKSAKIPKESSNTSGGKIIPQNGALMASEKVRLFQMETSRDLRLKKSKEGIIDASPSFFEAVMKTLFIAGFDIAEMDPVLDSHKLEELPYGNFFMRLSHKNLNKLSVSRYTVNLFLMITNDYDRVVVAKYCVYFPETETTILLPANLRGDWNFSWNQRKKDWHIITEEKISNFLDKLPLLVSFIERMKAKKVTAELSENVKRDIVTEFMNPSRINGRKFLWSKSDMAEFQQRPIYPKEENLFEAVANVIALFTAKTPNRIRVATSERTNKEYIKYSYCLPEVWENKNGKLAKGDIMEGKLAVPITFSRRTYFTFSNITDNVNKYLEDTSVKFSIFSI